MDTLIKPKKLVYGDKVATVSLSSGCAGDVDTIHRYNLGVSRLKEYFGLEVVAMPNSMKGSNFIYDNPKARAEDLMAAFKDPTIKGIITNIGGDDTARLLPYIDFDIIKNNPKIFLGFSDTTANHFMCLHAGLSSFYGTAILCEFAENVEMHQYTKEAIRKALFSDEPIGEILAPLEFATKFDTWSDENATLTSRRKFEQTNGFECLQGTGKVTGRLIGGCIEVIEMLKGSPYFPDANQFKDTILFFETSEDKPDPMFFKCWLRNYGILGILEKANGIIVGKPYDNTYYEEYKEILVQVVKGEFGVDIPILFNLPFGHTAPTCVIPYGAVGEIDCDNVSFRILESGVI